MTSPTDTLFTTDLSSQPTDTEEEFLAAGQEGPAGILEPGESVTVPLLVQAPAVAAHHSMVIDSPYIDASNSGPMTWAYASDALLSFAGSDPLEPTVLAAMETMIGPTWGDYDAMLAANASLLPASAGSPQDVDTLLQQEYEKAEATLTSSISGDVVSSSPMLQLAGQQIEATDTTDSSNCVATILNDGSFVFPDVDPGTYTLKVDGAAVVSTTPGIPTVAAGTPLAGVTVSVVPQDVVAGTVQDPIGAPVPNALVLVFSGSTEVGGAMGDSSGNYEVKGLALGTYTFVTSADGWAQTEQDNVAVSGTFNSVDLTIAAQATVTGLANFSDGSPVTDLYVQATLQNSPTPMSLFNAEGNSDGSFDMGGLPAGTYDINFISPSNPSSMATINGVIVGAGGQVTVGLVQLTDPPTTSNWQPEPPSTGDPADLSIGQTVSPAIVQPGGTLTYTLTVTNFGPDQANNVEVEESIASGEALGSATPPVGWGEQFSGLPNDVSFVTVGMLPNTSATFTIVMTAPMFNGDYTNEASVVSSTPDPNPADNESTVTITVTPTVADLSISINASPVVAAPTLVGEISGSESPYRNPVVTYTLTVTNAGPDAADDVMVTVPLLVNLSSNDGQCFATDPLPSGWKAAQVAPSLPGFAADLKLSVKSLAPGTAVTLTVYAWAQATPGTESTTAIVKSSTPDPNPANNQSTATFTIEEDPLFGETFADTYDDSIFPPASTSPALPAATNWVTLDEIWLSAAFLPLLATVWNGNVESLYALYLDSTSLSPPSDVVYGDVMLGDPASDLVYGPGGLAIANDNYSLGYYHGSDQGVQITAIEAAVMTDLEQDFSTGRLTGAQILAQGGALQLPLDPYPSRWGDESFSGPGHFCGRRSTQFRQHQL